MRLLNLVLRPRAQSSYRETYRRRYSAGTSERGDYQGPGSLGPEKRRRKKRTTKRYSYLVQDNYPLRLVFFKCLYHCSVAASLPASSSVDTSVPSSHAAP